MSIKICARSQEMRINFKHCIKWNWTFLLELHVFNMSILAMITGACILDILFTICVMNQVTDTSSSSKAQRPVPDEDEGGGE